MTLNLGIIKENGRIKNHRSVVKVLFNPFLRMIGMEIGTLYDMHKNTLGNPVIVKCPKKQLEFSFNYQIENNMEIINKRIFI